LTSLYKENNSIREIARVVHTRYRDYNKQSKIASKPGKRMLPKIPNPPPESGAFNMFSEGKSPTEVASSKTNQVTAYGWFGWKGCPFTLIAFAYL
jgi:hypothetical protein